MEYRIIKKNTDSLSILGFGCMRLPVVRRRIDYGRTERMIKTAIEGGVNYFDTSVIYHGGESEEVLGRVLEGSWREKVRIADKLTPWLIKDRRDMQRCLERQLNKLRTDRVDYYLLHALNREFWKKFCSLGALEFLEEQVKLGRIINPGFSFHGDLDTFKEIIDSYDWTICQIQYNFLDRRLQAGEEGLRYAAARDIGVIIMEPLRGGALIKKMPPDVAQVWSSGGQEWTPAQRALRWLWNQPEVKVVLSGMSNEQQVTLNIDAAQNCRAGSLSQNESALVDRVTAVYRKLKRTGCTGCRYCLPCPVGVNIPACLTRLDDLAIFKDRPGSFRLYILEQGGVNGDPSDASLCTGCGKCEEACPQQLPVRKLLKEVDGLLGGWRLKLARLPLRFYMKLKQLIRP